MSQLPNVVQSSGPRTDCQPEWSTKHSRPQRLQQGTPFRQQSCGASLSFHPYGLGLFRLQEYLLQKGDFFRHSPLFLTPVPSHFLILIPFEPFPISTLPHRRDAKYLFIMPHQSDDRTSASCSASESQACKTQTSEPSPTMGASQSRLPPKCVFLEPKIEKTGDSLHFRTDVATNWPSLLAIEGIRGLVSALPGFDIDNVSALSPEELVTERISKMQEIAGSGGASLKAFVDRIKQADSNVSVFIATQEVASANDSKTPPPHDPMESDQRFAGSLNPTDRDQNDQMDGQANQGLSSHVNTTRDDDESQDVRK